MKVIFVGGHHTPALAVIDSLRRKCQMSNVKLQTYWIGHKFSMWGDRNVSAEYQEVTGQEIPFYDLKAGKFFRTFHPLKLLRLPFGFFQALYFLLKIRPRLIVSFGGYLAVPVVFCGWILRIPIITHEQTVVSGWANRFIGKLAKKVFVSWPHSVRYFPKGKAIVTGNPLRESIFGTQTDKLNIVKLSNYPTVYITGGKQGSHIINEAVKGALEELLQKYNVIHQCGRSTVFDDYKELSAVRRHLSSRLRERYILKDYFGEGEIGAVYKAADLVVGRAGANTVYEIAALGKPALFIPIPWVSQKEQERNAQILVNVGSAKILPEKFLTPETLFYNILEMVERLDEFKKAAQEAKKLVRLDAASKIASEILSLPDRTW